MNLQLSLLIDYRPRATIDGEKMTDALAGKIVTSLTWTAPDETGAQALRDFFDFHKQYMIEKCHKEGPLKLI